MIVFQTIGAMIIVLSIAPLLSNGVRARR